MKEKERMKGAGSTCVSFHVGVAFVWWACGFAVAAAVAFVGYAVVGEWQRKINQVMDLIERGKVR